MGKVQRATDHSGQANQYQANLALPSHFFPPQVIATIQSPEVPDARVASRGYAGRHEGGDPDRLRQIKRTVLSLLPMGDGENQIDNIDTRAIYH
jgi:hypothetical protein